MIFFTHASSALQNVTKTVGFQGRLTLSTGAVVPDGYYNMQFKLYEGGSGTEVGNPGGSLKWYEDYVNNNANGGVRVKNGVFMVNLGSNNAFGTQVDWSSDTLWLSINVASNTATCTSFVDCNPDGEMLPMKRITATPFSLDSGAVGGKTADELVQLGQDSAQVDSTDNTSIAINKTGSGDVVNLQSSGKDIFTISNAGDISLGSNSNKTIGVSQSTAGSGQSLTLSAGSAASSGNLNGGDMILQGGAGNGNGLSGGVAVKANGSDSASTFKVQNAAGDSILNVDTSVGEVSTGTLSLASGALSGNAESTLHSLWENTSVSAPANNDGQPLNMGIVFRSAEAGHVSGIKYYNSTGNNTAGTDIGKLWACNNPNCLPGQGGTELATVIFPADSTAGWKTARFSSPFLVSPNTYYMVTYFSQQGWYSADSNYFNSQYNNYPLTVPRNDTPSTIVSSGFKMGDAGFPNNSWQAANYWVDLEFQTLTNTDRITSQDDLLISSAGKMTIGPINDSLKLQGTSITAKGDTTIQSGTSGDTSNTFRVQNASGDSLLNVSAAGNNISIGKNDTTGTLLVLDTKTNSGDPTGTDGAMYYNSLAKKFRCYENGAWKDCITPLPVSAVASVDTTSTSMTPKDVTGLEYTLLPNTKYYYKFLIIHTAAAESTGVGFGITAPSNLAMSNWCVNTTSNLGASTPGHWGTYCGVGDASATTTGKTGTGTTFTSTMEGYVQTGSQGGPLKLRYKSQSNNTTTVKAKSFGILQVVQ